jgi:hypothetical protein
MLKKIKVKGQDGSVADAIINTDKILLAIARPDEENIVTLVIDDETNFSMIGTLEELL